MSRYRVYLRQTTWLEAEKSCLVLGGHLATITSRDENDFVVDLARKARRTVWIGISDAGKGENWEWVTGEKVTFTAWAPGMPNRLRGVKQGVCLWKEADFAWDDGSGLGSTEKRHAFVCEWEQAAVAESTAQAPAAAASEGAETAHDEGTSVPHDELAAVLADFDALVEAGDYAGARKAAEGMAAKAKSPVVGRALRSAARVAGLLESRQETVRHAADALVGKEIRLATRKGTQRAKLVEVTEAGLTLAVQMKSGRRVIGETRMPVAWSELVADQEDRFANGWEPGGAEGALARAAIALKREDTDGAEREIAVAAGHPLAEHFSQKAEALRLKAAEGSALAAWDTIRRWAKRPKMSLEQAKALFDLVASFEEKYQASRHAVSNRSELAAAKMLAQRVLTGAGVVSGALEYGGRRYKRYGHAMSWADAKDFCKRLGGHLVTITSKEENDFVTGITREAKAGIWIGLTDETGAGEWRWTTGEKMGFAAWSGGMPGGRGRRAFISPQHRCEWTTSPEGEFRFFLCEWEPPRRGQPPASSVSEEPFELQLGHTKAVAYREDFETGAGGWEGQVLADAERGSRVLRLKHTPDNKYHPVMSGRYAREGIAASVETRFAFRYRTEGELARVVTQHWLIDPAGEGQNYYLNLPASLEWASVDFPVGRLTPNGRLVTDLAKGFRITSTGVYAGGRGQEGECFIDDFEVYDVASGAGTPSK